MRFNRRQRLIVSKVQYRLLAVQVIQFTIIMLVFLSAVFLPVIVAMGQGDPGNYFTEADQFLTLHKRLWPPLLLALFLFVLNSIILAHRVAGPLYRMGCVMKEVGKGDVTIRAKIRKPDYLHAEVADLNEMIQRLQLRLGEIEIASLEAAQLLAKSRNALGAPNAGDQIAKLEAAIARTQPTEHGFVLDKTLTDKTSTRHHQAAGS